MTDHLGDNVWGRPTTPAQPRQSWPSRAAVLPPPTRPTNAGPPRRPPPDSRGRAPRRSSADLIRWGLLAAAAFLLLLGSFAMWDRPTDTQPAVPASTTVPAATTTARVSTTLPVTTTVPATTTTIDGEAFNAP